MLDDIGTGTRFIYWTFAVLFLLLSIPFYYKQLPIQETLSPDIYSRFIVIKPVQLLMVKIADGFEDFYNILFNENDWRLQKI